RHRRRPQGRGEEGVAPPRIGVDLGGTRIRVGAVAADGRILTSLERLTDARRGSDAVLDTLISAIADVRASIGEVAGAGIACAGQIRPDDGLVVQAPNIGWRDFPLGTRLTTALRMPVIVENDVRAAAW